MLGYLPAKFKIRFLEPIDTVELGGADAVHDKALVQTVAQEIRARIQENLHEMVGDAEVGLVRMSGRARRAVLVTGLSTYWGARLAQALEGFEQVEAIIGVDSRDPTLRARAHRVRQGLQPALADPADRPRGRDRHRDRHADDRQLARRVAPRDAHENNVIGTMNILAACTGSDSPVRKFIFKSSTHYYGSEQDDPAFFTERMRRPHPPRTPLERDIVEAEDAVADFADKRPDVTVTVLRCANVLGPDVDTGVHADARAAAGADGASASTRGCSSCTRTTSCTRSSTRRSTTAPGTFNVAADGVLALSEAIVLLGKRPLPVLPPIGTGLLAAPLRRLGFRVPDEMANQLRFGRGVDNRLYKATGFSYGYTSRETVIRLGEHLRLEPILRGAPRGRLPLRARGRGVPALEPARAPRSAPATGVAADREPLGI